ncbi:MAG: thioredoxin family protein, partial [Planctomycetaceae bacterium]|nr:thioredoxin family protein [Planctomycetaceae bacterium]
MLFSPRLFLSTLVCSVLVTGVTLGESKHTTHWHSDLATAQADAKEMNKPVLLHFYADWCGPCKQMEATVFEAAEFKKLLGTEVVGVKINGDYHSNLISRFSIKAYPADVLLSPDGKELKRSLGRVSLNQYVSLLQQTAAPYRVAQKEKAPEPVAKTVIKV